MNLQDDAADRLAAALRRLGLGQTRISHDRYPSVSVLEHPGAVVTFKLGGLGELKTEFVFDGRRPEVLRNPDTVDDADAVAWYIAEKIAGVGGRPPA